MATADAASDGVNACYVLTPAPLDALPTITAMEAASYPADEAASPEALHTRVTAAAPYFKTAVTPATGDIVGYMCGTVTNDSSLTMGCMKGHVADGHTLCIHSVVVREDVRRRGVALWMVRRYVEQVALEQPHLRRILLIAKDGVKELYKKAGFVDHGLSRLEFGADPWYQLGLELPAAARHLKYAVADAFTTKPVGGNPAALVWLPSVLAVADAETFPPSPGRQTVALEHHLSETAFVQPVADGTFQLRWFTPTVEVDLCGHATLASAHLLLSLGYVAAPHNRITFRSRSGLLHAERSADDGTVELNFPAEPATECSAERRAVVLAAVTAAFADLPPGAVEFVGENRMDTLVAIRRAAFDALTVTDLSALLVLGVRGVIVTTAGGGEPYDCMSRFFAPGAGVPEDPVTGSAHCALYPYWAGVLGKTDIVARQASARGGDLWLRSVDGGRVGLRGHAVETMSGQLSAALSDLALAAST